MLHYCTSVKKTIISNSTANVRKKSPDYIISVAMAVTKLACV